MFTRISFAVAVALSSFCPAFGADAIDIEAMWRQQAGEVLQSSLRVPGVDGYAWDLYNNPQAIQMASGISVGDDYTVTVWFNLSDSTGRSALLSSAAHNHWLLMINAGKSISLERRGRPAMHIEHQLMQGRWYHLALTVSEQTVSMYLDGELLGARSFPPLTKQAPPGNIRVVGAHQINTRGTSDHFFKGLIDKPMFYRKALTCEEIGSQYAEATQTLPIVPMPKQVFVNPIDTPMDASRGFAVNLATTMLKSDDLGFEWLSQACDGKVWFDGRKSAIELTLWNLTQDDCPPKLKHLIDAELPSDGYVLWIRSNAVHLAAVTPRGLFYGLVTLTEMLKQKSDWPAMLVFDYPTFPFRCGMYVNDRQPPISINENLTSYVEAMARYKVPYFMPRTHCWFDLDSPATRQAVLDLDSLLKRHHMELVPYLQLYGHAKGPLWKDLKTGHTRTIEDEEHVAGDQPSQLAVANVIITERTPIIVRTADGKTLVEGADYRIIEGKTVAQWSYPPDSTFRGKWAKPYIPPDNEPYRIQWLAAQPGTKVLVTYDVAADTEGTCPFQKEYHELLDDVITKTMELVNPSMINLGMDEIWSPKGPGRCCNHSDLTGGQLMVYEFQRTFEAVKKIAPGIEVMFFNDMMDPVQTPRWKSTADLSWFTQGKLDREFTQMPWSYSQDSLIKSRAASTLDWALQYSNRVIPAAGHRFANILYWSYLCLEHLPTGRTPGVLFTRWASVPKSAGSVGYQAYAQSMWSPDYLMIPNMLEVFWKLGELGLTPQSSPEDVDGVISTLKNHPIQVAQLAAYVALADRELHNLAGRAEIDQLEAVAASVEQARRIVTALGN